MIQASPPHTDKSISASVSKPSQSSQMKNFVLGIGVLLNLTVWGVVLLVLQNLTPNYTSRGSAIIAGTGFQDSVELPDLAKRSDGGGKTPYGSLLKVDPRENYRYIALTDTVIADAAAAVDMSIEEFGIPDIWLMKGTTIMEFEVTGETPEIAQEKAQAFFDAWVNRITELRNTESQRQEDQTSRVLESAGQELEDAQRKVTEFRTQSPLKEVGQIKQLSEQVENLRIQRANLYANQKAVEASFRRLSSQLNFSATEAKDALVLLDDRVFQNSLQKYVETTSNLETLSSAWAPNTPPIILEKANQEAAQKAMLERSRRLLEKPVTLDFLVGLDLGERGRRDMIEELVGLQTEQEGLMAQVQTLEGEIEQLELRLKNLTSEEFTLSALKRDLQISELIFAEGVARLDIEKPDYATYYPTLQLISEPSLPLENDSSEPKALVLGALAFSVLSITGLLMFGWAKTQYQNILVISRNSEQK